MVISPAVAVFRRFLVALILSVLVGIATFPSSIPAWAVESWSTPVDLSATGQNATVPQIVAAPNNTLTAIWYRSNGANNIVQTASSTDAGATWSAVVDLSATGQNAFSPQIVAAPNNTLTAIWYRNSGLEDIIQTASSTDGGATWSTPVDLSPRREDAYDPQIVAAPNNTLTAIWYWSNGANNIIQTRSSTDGGATWSTLRELSSSGQDAYAPQIVAAPNNTLTAIWFRSNGANNIIQTASSTDAGATWSTPVDLSVAGQSANEPQIVAAPNNTLTAIWRRSNGANNIIQTASSTDAGATWTAVVDLSVAGQSAGAPQIVAAPNNTLTAIWYRYNGAHFIIQTASSTDAGATWTAPVDLSATGQGAYGQQIVAAPNNTLTAIWYRYNGAHFIIQTASSTDGGATWSTVVDLSATGQNSGIPQIVALPNNTLTAIWESSDGANTIIQSSSSSAASSSSVDAGVPGIFLTVAGPVGRSASEAPIYYGADRVAVTSTYLLTVTRVSNVTPTITTLAEGTINANGSFSSMTRLPALTPGVYNVKMAGTHVNGSTLQLTSQITIGGLGEFTSIGANIPVIK